MAPMSPVPAARSVSSRMRSFSPAVNVRRLGRSDNSGLAAAGAGTTVGLRPSSVPAPAAAFVSATLLGMTTRQFSYALKSKLPGRLCLIIIGTEGEAPRTRGLIKDQHRLLITQVFDDIDLEIVAYRLGVPAGAGQEILHRRRRDIFGGLGQVPAVLALQRCQKTAKVAQRPAPPASWKNR